QLVSNPVLASNVKLAPGDKIYVVGFPYGFSSAGPGVPTSVVLTRFVRAATVSGRRQEFLLGSGGAPRMSGGPGFVERDNVIALLGVSTGVIYPEPIVERSKNGNALGSCADLSLCWRGSLPLVREPTQALCVA